MDVYYLYRDLHFVWDGLKAIENRKKHRVSFEEACEAFFDESSVYVDATVDEPRSAVIGMVAMARFLYVVHVVREEETIRIISARSADQKEERIYEDG